MSEQLNRILNLKKTGQVVINSPTVNGSPQNNEIKTEEKPKYDNGEAFNQFLLKLVNKQFNKKEFNTTLETIQNNKNEETVITTNSVNDNNRPTNVPVGQVAVTPTGEPKNQANQNEENQADANVVESPVIDNNNVINPPVSDAAITPNTEPINQDPPIINETVIDSNNTLSEGVKIETVIVPEKVNQHILNEDPEKNINDEITLKELKNMIEEQNTLLMELKDKISHLAVNCICSQPVNIHLKS